MVVDAMLKIEEPFAREQLYSGILESLDELPERLRTVFVLRHYQGCQLPEIAQMLDIREDEVPFLLKRAEQHFYRSLRRIQE
jgi:RNA polymerase sigma factor (sigma-70 family)